MAKEDGGFDAMMNIWKEGQDAFFKAQKEVADNFSKSFSGISPASPIAPDNPFSSMMDWQSFIKSWAPAWDPSSVMGEHMADQFGKHMFNQGRDAFAAMLDPANWTQFAPEQLRTILMSVSKGPQFADLATPQVDAAAAWRETLDYQKAAADLAGILQQAWKRTYERYTEKYTLEDLQSGNVQDALNTWLKIANEELLETQRTVAFMDAQKRMLRASLEIKARQRDIAETWSEAYQIPTRTEVDDLIKIVHELRRELRTVKRELASLK